MNRFISLGFIFLTAFVAGKSLLAQGLPPTHDGEYHIVRFYEFDKVLRSGSLYPRWAPDLNKGYGIPLFNYVYPLPNYIASFFHLFGISFIDAFKLNLFFATMVGSISMYAWAKKFWGEAGGVVSSVFYTFAPYHFVDIYIRGSVGEVWALAFFPAFLWSITNVIKKKNKIFVIFSGLFLALIIFSHNILALMFFPFAFSYTLFLFLLSNEKLYALRSTLYAFALGLGVSAIFWIPALFEQQYVTGLQIYDIEKNFPELYQLLIPSWGSGFSEGALGNQMSFQIGIANLIAIAASVIATIVLLRRRQKKEAKTITFFLICFFSILFFMFRVSLPAWENVPLLDYFQFPWRLLSLIILICSFLTGSIIFSWKSRIVFFVLFLLPIIFGIGYAKPAYYHQRQDEYYLTRSNFIDGTNSPGDLFNTVWFNRNLKKQKEKIAIEHGRAVDVQISPAEYVFSAEVDLDSQVTVNTAYFPGWRATTNKKNIHTKPDKNGLVTFSLSKGNHKIKLFFGDTMIRSISAGISLVSLLSVILYFFLSYRGILLINEKK